MIRRTTDPALRVVSMSDTPARLEELCDRVSLKATAESAEHLLGVPVRIVSTTGAVLAQAGAAALVCALINEHPRGHAACGNVVAASLRTPTQPSDKACFTGALYRTFPIEYDKRAIGAVVIGPFIPAGAEAMPPSLLAVDPALDASRVAAAWSTLARADLETIDRLGAHLCTVLDAVVFSGHKVRVTSEMHVASIQESYRELTEKNERLEEAYERLQELDRLKSNFLATVSHELRTPLTSIMGYGEMLAEGMAGPLSPEQQEFVQTIRQKSEQLLSLIVGLLDLSKLESGMAPVKMARVSIDHVLEEACSTLAPAAKKKAISLQIELSADLPPLYADGERLRQVFINLTENAIKFTPFGGSVVLMARLVAQEIVDEPGVVVVAPVRQAIEVRVIDTGVGIPVSQRAKVFDAFYQIDQSSTREQGGAGLGLAIVKRLVEAHQGFIAVEDNQPHGAVFVVTLPATRMGSSRPSRPSLPAVFE